MDPARCATHPDRSAAATCARCGTFMCTECGSDELAGHCQSCARRLQSGRWVPQVPMLGIALMIHGGLTVGLALYYLVFGVFMVYGLREQPVTGPPMPGEEWLPGIMVGAFLGLGLAHLLPGALQLLAGFRVRRFQSRTLALVALAAGVVTALGCYCAPTSLGLAIWGAIVLLQGEVGERFAAAKSSAIWKRPWTASAPVLSSRSPPSVSCSAGSAGAPASPAWWVSSSKTA